MKCSLGIFIFLKRSLVFPILLFSSISLHGSLRKAFLSLLAFLWNSAFKWVYLSFSPLSLASLLFSAICKAYSDNHFAFFHFFFYGMVLITSSCTMFCLVKLGMLFKPGIWLFMPFSGAKQSQNSPLPPPHTHLIYGAASPAFTAGSLIQSLPVRAVSRKVRSLVRGLLCFVSEE